MSWKRVGRGPLPGSALSSGFTNCTILAVSGAIGLGRPWYAHFMQHEEHDWRESSEILRGSRDHPRDSPLHTMHGERTPWPGVVCTVCVLLHCAALLWYFAPVMRAVRHTYSCSTRTFNAGSIT